MNRYFVTTIVGSLAAAIFVAGLPLRDKMPGAAAAAPVGERSPSSPNPWSSGHAVGAPATNAEPREVRLSRAGDGHFYSHAAIGSATVRVVVDTGASGPVNGIVRRLPRVDVGGIVVQDLDAMVIPEGLDITLLGQNYLARVDKVAIEGGEMVLSDR